MATEGARTEESTAVEAAAAPATSDVGGAGGGNGGGEGEGGGGGGGEGGGLVGRVSELGAKLVVSRNYIPK